MPPKQKGPLCYSPIVQSTLRAVADKAKRWSSGNCYNLSKDFGLYHEVHIRETVKSRRGDNARSSSIMEPTVKIISKGRSREKDAEYDNSYLTKWILNRLASDLSIVLYEKIKITECTIGSGRRGLALLLPMDNGSAPLFATVEVSCFGTNPFDVSKIENEYKNLPMTFNVLYYDRRDNLHTASNFGTFYELCSDLDVFFSSSELPEPRQNSPVFSERAGDIDSELSRLYDFNRETQAIPEDSNEPDSLSLDGVLFSSSGDEETEDFDYFRGLKAAGERIMDKKKRSQMGTQSVGFSD